jgi:hypothetical protein
MNKIIPNLRLMHAQTLAGRVRNLMRTEGADLDDAEAIEAMARRVMADKAADCDPLDDDLLGNIVAEAIDMQKLDRFWHG